MMSQMEEQNKRQREMAEKEKEKLRKQLEGCSTEDER